MRRDTRRRISAEQGFTLIELMVVILIIGILAATALPAFLGQRPKGQDSSAKSNARNVVSQVESCYTTSENYASCTDAATETGIADTTVTAVTAPGATTAQGFTIVATSKSDNTFRITKDAGTGVVTRTCSSAGTTKGGCNGSTW